MPTKSFPGNYKSLNKIRKFVARFAKQAGLSDDGIYAVAGDVFWWTDDQEQTMDVNAPDNDPEHMNHTKLTQSRKKLLAIADFIIPGHGEMFTVGK